MTPRRGLALLLALSACRERYRPVFDAARDAERDAAVSFDVADAADAESSARARLTITAVLGGAAVDASLRCATERLARGSESAPQQAAAGRSLFACDQCVTGADGNVTVALDDAARASLGADARVEAAGYAGAAMTLSLGTLAVTVPMLAREPARVDTPAGRLIVSSGRALVSVAHDGSVRVSVDEGAATLWPSPPAPPRRATALSEPERRRLALASPGHPILADVDLPELAAAALRPIAARALSAGESLAFSPSGAPLAGALPRATGDALTAAVERWRQLRDARVNRPDAHLFAIEDLSRAGAGDVADLRVALARLRARGDLSTRDRDELTARVSLALGRLTARARRGRELAARGGNVTALVQTAPLEELRDAARAYAPLR